MYNNPENTKAIEHLEIVKFIIAHDKDLDQNTRQQLYAMINLNLLNMSNRDLMEIAKIIAFPSELSIRVRYEEIKQDIDDIRDTMDDWIKLVPAIYEVGVKENDYKVIIIEDKLFLKVALISAFHKAGFVTFFEDKFSESLYRIVNLKPNIAIVDCELSDMDGFSACSYLHRYFNIPVILVGENSNDNSWNKAMLSDAIYFDYKPHNWTVLPTIAKAILRNYSSTFD